MKRTITNKEMEEILEESLGFTSEEYNNLRRISKKELEKQNRRLIVLSDSGDGGGDVWTDSTVIIS